MGDRILLMGLPTSLGIGTVQLYYRGVWGGKWPRNEEALTTRKECESHGRAEGGVRVHMNTVTAKPRRQHWLLCPLRSRQDAGRKPVLPPPELS